MRYEAGIREEDDLERVDAAASLEPRLLQHVVDLCVVLAHEAPEHHAQPRRVPVIERAKRALIAVEKTVYEDRIRKLCRYDRGRHRHCVHAASERVALYYEGARIEEEEEGRGKGTEGIPRSSQCPYPPPIPLLHFLAPGSSLLAPFCFSCPAAPTSGWSSAA